MSAVISIARLIPIYTSGHGALSKREAVRTVTELRLTSDGWRGKGSRARRRILKAHLCKQ